MTNFQQIKSIFMPNYLEFLSANLVAKGHAPRGYVFSRVKIALAISVENLLNIALER